MTITAAAPFSGLLGGMPMPDAGGLAAAPGFALALDGALAVPVPGPGLPIGRGPLPALAGGTALSSASGLATEALPAGTAAPPAGETAMVPDPPARAGVPAGSLASGVPAEAAFATRSLLFSPAPAQPTPAASLEEQAPLSAAVPSIAAPATTVEGIEAPSPVRDAPMPVVDEAVADEEPSPADTRPLPFSIARTRPPRDPAPIPGTPPLPDASPSQARAPDTHAGATRLLRPAHTRPPREPLATTETAVTASPDLPNTAPVLPTDAAAEPVAQVPVSPFPPTVQTPVETQVAPRAGDDMRRPARLANPGRPNDPADVPAPTTVNSPAPRAAAERVRPLAATLPARDASPTAQAEAQPHKEASAFEAEPQPTLALVSPASLSIPTAPAVIAGPAAPTAPAAPAAPANTPSDTTIPVATRPAHARHEAPVARTAHDGFAQQLAAAPPGPDQAPAAASGDAGLPLPGALAQAATTERVETPTAPDLRHLPVASARPGAMGREVGVEIARQVVLGHEQVTIRLDPGEMGRIEVRMHFDERGSLQAVVAADRPAALDLLRRESADLGRALADAGVRADAGSFRFDSRSGGSDGGSAWQRHQPGGHSASTGRGYDSGMPAADEPAYRSLRTSGSVDLMA